MKLVFRKNAEEEITVVQSYDGAERDFDYSDMIKVLLEDGELELPDIEGDFTADEASSINKMVEEINAEARDAARTADDSDEVSEDRPL